MYKPLNDFYMLTTFHTVDKHFPKKGKKITLETKKAFFSNYYFQSTPTSSLHITRRI